MCLSATCPPKVLEDLVTNLKLKAIVDGSCQYMDKILLLLLLLTSALGANTEGTVYFSAPLYRKNLHYMVLPKHHHSASKVIEHITEYILEHHPNDSGIVYCASKKVRLPSQPALSPTTDVPTRTLKMSLAGSALKATGK